MLVCSVQSPNALTKTPSQFRSAIPMPGIGIYHSPPPMMPCAYRSCPWWPYRNSNDFKINAAIIIVVLFCALGLVIAFNAAVRYLIRHRKRAAENQNTESESDTRATEEMRSGAAECIICLSELEVGERIRVLDKCRHGFHVQCVQKWLASHSSCPTCRTRCH